MPTPEVTFRFARDFQVIWSHPELLYAKLYNSRAYGFRITRCAYRLFTEGGWITKTFYSPGPRVRSRAPSTNNTPRAMN